MCVCGCMYVDMPQHVCGHATACIWRSEENLGKLILCIYHWIQDIELRSLNPAAGAFTRKAISPALFLIYPTMSREDNGLYYSKEQIDGMRWDPLFQLNLLSASQPAFCNSENHPRTSHPPRFEWSRGSGHMGRWCHTMGLRWALSCFLDRGED